uniref:Alternative protein AVL9 n=1 Tax=Homo sapiens TaxID=9606 RepID=L8E8M3_HUMAN|nr:alternative protein AVL9 [Homo sapiens]
MEEYSQLQGVEQQQASSTCRNKSKPSISRPILSIRHEVKVLTFCSE